MKTWTVAQTKYNNEWRVARRLLNAEFDYYLPVYRDPKTGRKGLMYPSYIFIRLAKHWHRVYHTEGVSHYFTCNSIPQKLPKGFIEDLQKREDDYGVINLEGFRPGQKLRILRGKLNSMLATYKGYDASKRRDIASVMLFGQSVDVEFRRGALSAE